MTKHMKTLFTYLLFLTSTSCCLAQQINLTGQISIHNSRYETGEIEYVQNAFIEAPFAGSTNSDSEGLFRLIFQGIAAGETIRLAVEKAGLEIVNRKDLSEVVLGRLQPLQIYLAPKGKLAQAQVELFNISKSALLRRHNAQIALLRQANAQSDSLIQELQQKLNTEIANRFEAEELLNQQLLDVQRRLPEMAKKLSQVNLDFVSDMYREAYEYLRIGEVELAIETLDEAVLDEEARLIIERITIAQAGLDSLELAEEINLAALDTLVRSQVLQARILAEEEHYEAAATNFQEALQNLVYITPKGTYSAFEDYQTAALLAYANREWVMACVLFETSLKQGGLSFPTSTVVYPYDKIALEHYVKLVEVLKR